ncbi:hypothetical protein [Methanoregula sp.]|uniref:hypothetical protein n=1 Tax=Methanoregula sp. TaxID=2052170 RepID=UPI0023751EB7|nr:hypothetical protein [Methanoregula sp.]MDD1686207.1 hypothetical protein [Methanoregula sp.]
MSRGRRPLVALSEAVHIAKKRGETRQFMHEPGMICNFVIYCPGFTAHVRIKRVTRVHCSHAWIEGEARDALAALRAIASGPGISRELWVFLPRGAFRFFRATDTGLIELSRDGSMIPERPKPAFVAVPVVQAQPTVPAQEIPAGTEIIPPIQAPPREISVGTKRSEKSQGE